jgi:hypothetical protein
MSDDTMRRQTNSAMSPEAWREGRLRLAGFEQEAASQLAEDNAVDVHALLELWIAAVHLISRRVFLLRWTAGTKHDPTRR